MTTILISMLMIAVVLKCIPLESKQKRLLRQKRGYQYIALYLKNEAKAMEYDYLKRIYLRLLHGKKVSLHKIETAIIAVKSIK